MIARVFITARMTNTLSRAPANMLLLAALVAPVPPDEMMLVINP